MSYFDIYKKRLNRYGLDYQSRVQGQRERDFDNYLLKSVYRVDFQYNDIYVPAILENYKQNYSEDQRYLLTKRDILIPNGTIIMIDDANGINTPWMIWWEEETQSRGYNRYVVLKMTHFITWRDSENNQHQQWAYYKGTGTSTISDAIKSSTGEALYKQNDNLLMLITPYNTNFGKDNYVEISNDDTNTAYIITDIDIHSTKGIMYISIDPSYIREQDSDMQSAQSHWLQGGW